MKKILYITHLPWGNIKQRPQFLAEGLAEHNFVDVWYRKSNRFWRNINSVCNSDTLNVRGFTNLPFERISFLPLKLMNVINKLLFSCHNIPFESYDVIWITDPCLYDLFSNKVKSKFIVYDCMDDLLEFPYIKKYPKLLNLANEAELRLLKQADEVICSAQTLAHKLQFRYKIDRNFRILNNAITENIFTYPVDDTYKLPKNSFVYIGTISEWLDFESILTALNEIDDIHVVMFGPKAVNDFPQHPRLIYKGVIQHQDIMTIMMASKALIMPFIVNDLILSVNPVKLYEYCYSGKPIISSHYGETEKFSKYVKLYRTPNDFVQEARLIMSEQLDENKIDEMRRFSLENTWKNRINHIMEFLNIRK